MYYLDYRCIDNIQHNARGECSGMDHMLDIFSNQNQLMVEDAKNEIRNCNDFTEKFGLILSEKDIEELVQCRLEALKNTGRVEFGGGILPKLIYAFCDSPFIRQDNYETTLVELQEAFYYYKSEALDYYTDDELIEFMVVVFNGRAQGSAEYLVNTSLEALCRYARNGYDDRNVYEAGDLF